MANNFDPTVSWADDELGATAKLNQMVENDNVIYNLVPHLLYKQGTSALRDFNDSQSRVLKPTFYCGRIAFTIKGRHGQTRTVGFPPGTFAASCRPVILTQVSATGHERYMLSTIASTTNYIDVKNDGFKVQMYHRDGEKFQSNVSVHYLAIGWQEA